MYYIVLYILYCIALNCKLYCIVLYCIACIVLLILYNTNNQGTL
jgi:hypothetical protein